MQKANDISVLIIDDDDCFREMLTDSLSEEGYRVYQARDGREGLKVHKNYHPNLVITDIIMPEMEGIEVIRTLRKSDPKTPIIAISGGGRIEPDNYLVLAEALGAVATLSKPFQRFEMIEAIKEAISS